MRLQQYLTEASRTKMMRDEAFIKKAKDYTDAIRAFVYDDVGIYRGIPSHNALFGYVQPSKFERKSANTLNYYTLLIDNMDAWSKFPPRSKSIICTTRRSSAGGYGAIFAVFPKNGATIGVAQRQDFWISFKNVALKNFGDLDDLNTYINFALNIAFSFKNNREFSPYAQRDNSYKEVVDLIEYFDSIYEENKEQIIVMAAQNLPDRFIFMRLVEGGLMKNLRDMLDPQDNGFYTVSSRQIRSLKARDSNEVWTDSDCLLVNVDGSYKSGDNRFYTDEQLKDWFMSNLSI